GDRVVLGPLWHAAGLIRLHLHRLVIGADQRRLALCRCRLPRALMIEEPQPAREHGHRDAGQHRGRPAPARRGEFLVAIIAHQADGIIVPFLITPHMLLHLYIPPLTAPPVYISSTGSTPNTCRPEAMTSATARTKARRARVSSGSPPTRKRNVASSLPLVHNRWNCAATS